MLPISTSFLVVEPPVALAAVSMAVAAEVEYSVMVLFVVCNLLVGVGCGNGTCTVFLQVATNSANGNNIQNLATNSANRQWLATAQVHVGICGFCTEWH